MIPPLPYPCLQEIFEFVLHSNSGLLCEFNLNNLHSCALVCKIWNEIAIPILWRDPFCNHPKIGKETILIDVYLSSFTLEELKNLKLPPNLVEYYEEKRPKYDYVKYLRRINLTQIRTATSFWLENKKVHTKNIITEECQIFQLLCSHFVGHAISIKCVEFEPELKSLIDFNIFKLSGAEISLSGLKEISCYGEAHNINLFEQASKISTRVQNLKICLLHGCPLNPSTLNDLSNYIKSQRRLKEFSIDNRIGCYCCLQDLSLALDLTIVFKSLSTQSITLSQISFISINFHNNFPMEQLSKCNNLKELNITRCWNFGDVHLIDLSCNSFRNLSDLRIVFSSIPAELVKILLIQSGKSLKSLEFEQKREIYPEIFTEILKYCSENNSNLIKAFIYIDPREVQYLPKFLRSTAKLCNLNLWDTNILNVREVGETIDLEEELFADIGESLPNSLKNLTINMKWKFESKSLERFIKNCKAPLEFLGFEFCECFDNEHFDVLVKNLKRTLRNLNIRHCSAKLNEKTRMNNRHLIQQIESRYSRS